MKSIVPDWSKSPLYSTAPSHQQPLGMGLGSWNVLHEVPSLAPLSLPSPAWWPMGQLLPRRLDVEES